MKMKVLHVDLGKYDLMRNDLKQLSTQTHLIQEEKSFQNRRYFVYSVRVQSNQNSIGVESKIDNQIVESLNTRIQKGNERLRRLRFIVIDTKKKMIYYDGYRGDVELILKEFFNLDKGSLSSQVSIDDLVYLSEITIVNKNIENKGFFDKSEILTESQNIEKLFKGSSFDQIEESRYSIKLKDETKASPFFKEKYVNQKELDNTEELFFEGMDKHGNELIYDSFLSKKIEILPEYETFDDKMELDLETVLNALLEKVGE